MTGKNYVHFSAENFASDTYFQKWVLEDDHMANLFWEKWLEDNPQKKPEVDLAKEIIHQFAFKEYIVSKEDFNEVWKNIKETHTSEVDSVRTSKKIGYTATAAIMALLVSSVVFFDKRLDEFIEIETEVVAPKTNTIQAGTDKAVLTLADGFDVELIKGESYTTKNASSDGKEIVYVANSTSKEMVYNYLTIPRGGQFFIKLSDGTQVWLNSDSRLKYPVAFPDGETRQVELVYGEAYFDVAPSTEHNGAKFKVINQAQEVEVLGTEFNIKAYKDETDLYTTLVEGKVSVNILNRGKTLLPNQQLRLDLKNNNTVVSTVDVYRETSWKQGVFSFKNKPLKDIMRVISRWYKIDVIFKDKALESTVFNGTLRKNLSIVDILETIGSVNGIDYEIEDKTVVLK